MTYPIRIAALGRDGKVGDLYNYFTDVIYTSSVNVDSKKISETVGKPTLLFHQQPEKCKSHFLGIDSHLLQNMKRWSVPGPQLWFADYLNTNSMDGDEEHAQVTLLFRVVRRTETVDLEFSRSKIDHYRQESANVGALHVIDEVLYGAEVICSMRKTLDLTRETKASTELSIYIAAKKYLNEIIMESTSAVMPVELKKVSITILSSIKSRKKTAKSFISLIDYLQHLLRPGTIHSKWKPIEFVLRNEPAIRTGVQLQPSMKANVTFKERVIRYISNDPSLKHFPLLEKHVRHFDQLLSPVWKKAEEVFENQNYESPSTETDLKRILPLVNGLDKIIKWLDFRRKEIQKIDWLFGGTDLVLLDMQEIEAQMTTKACKTAKLFVFKVEYRQDFTIPNAIKKWCGQEISPLPVLAIFTYEKERLESVRTAIREFANEARLAKLSSANGTSYYVGIDPSMWNDETIKTVDYSVKSKKVISEDNPVEYLKKEQQRLENPRKRKKESEIPNQLRNDEETAMDVDVAEDNKGEPMEIDTPAENSIEPMEVAANQLQRPSAGKDAKNF
ncbi:hypothetical protein GHT06_013816 [Daphnia sinensis]|uniref:Uncharacterized protein n=1 Tax=Daphnia sinensis TaxID=1820382 RepID=A0AAD5KUI6_9CRUS|nr:hypothetical protein GHT06_013816 [Daphnia sinensis]